MFPFSYKKQFKFDDVDHLLKSHKDLIIDSFKVQFDGSKVNGDEISFRNFNSILKRHQWLSEGNLTFNYSNGVLVINLELGFYFFPLIIILFSLIIFFTNLKNIWFGILGVSMFYIFYGGLYFWTTRVFNSVINGTLAHQLNLMRGKTIQTINHE